MIALFWKTSNVSGANVRSRKSSSRTGVLVGFTCSNKVNNGNIGTMYTPYIPTNSSTHLCKTPNPTA